MQQYCSATIDSKYSRKTWASLSGVSWAAWVRVVVREGVAEDAKEPPQPSPTCTSAPLCYGGVLWGATCRTQTTKRTGRRSPFHQTSRDVIMASYCFTFKSHLYYTTLYQAQIVFCISIKISVLRAEYHQMDFALIYYTFMIEIHSKRPVKYSLHSRW